jgi:hypothetical protein
MRHRLRVINSAAYVTRNGFVEELSTWLWSRAVRLATEERPPRQQLDAAVGVGSTVTY